MFETLTQTCYFHVLKLDHDRKIISAKVGVLGGSVRANVLKSTLLGYVHF